MGEFSFADLNLIHIWSWCCCRRTSKRQSLLFILVVFVVHFWTSSGAQWHSLPCTWTLYSDAYSICTLAGTQVQVKQCVETSKVAGVKTGGVSRWIFVVGFSFWKRFTKWVRSITCCRCVTYTPESPQLGTLTDLAFIHLGWACYMTSNSANCFTL